MIYSIKKEGAVMPASERDNYSANKIIDNIMAINPKFAEALKDHVGDISDGYHTFNELYHHRALLFATICNLFPDKAWKSTEHDDPNNPMYEDMFICGIETPMGQATYHYNLEPYWDFFNVKVLDKAPKYDGHTPEQAIQRIFSLTQGK